MGKGRAGRDWWSPKGNLYLSVLLRPDIDAARLPRASILAGLAIFRAIGIEGGEISLKWPNDLLLNGRKVAGILPTARTEGSRIAWVVIGFGANMKEPDESVPGDLEGRIAFLDEVVEIGTDITREDLAQGIIDRLLELKSSFEGPAWEKAREEWSRQAVFGPSYMLRDGKKMIEGVPLRLAEDGGLVMETEKGKMTVYAGELEKTI
jgi:BirA family biotin operon repressor/biotin-[acetyl-CoA-carboxylase] ligase